MRVAVSLVIVFLALTVASVHAVDSEIELLHRLEREHPRAAVRADVAFRDDSGDLRPGVRCATRPVPDVERGLIAAAIDRHLAASGTAHRRRAVVIPVAFHVLRRADGGWDVSDERIDRQIEVINDAFAGTGFSFVLDRVARYDSNRFAKKCYRADAEFRFKRRFAVNPATTLNVYTCRPTRGVLGYAYLPSDFPEDDFLHGVVVHHTTVPGGKGAPYNQGDTLVHELGHYLGLFHTFQGRCGPKGDRVADTPAEERPTYDCPIGRDSCPDDPGLDPVTNFMDYNDDACVEEFSAGQAKRMMDQVATFKPSL